MADHILAILIGIASGILLFSVLLLIDNNTPSASVAYENIVYRYQTLITGFAAIAGALLTIRYMRDAEERGRAAKYASSRVFLSLALSDVCEYSRRSIEYLRLLYLLNEQYGDVSNIPKAIKIPDPPNIPQLISVFRDLIENSSFPDQSGAVNVLSKVQICASRADSAHSGS